MLNLSITFCASHIKALLESGNNNQQHNSENYQSYYNWNIWNNWQVVEEQQDDYFTEYGYTTQEWQQYQGRNGDDDAYEGNDDGNEANDQNNQENADDGGNDGGNDSDDGAQQENQGEMVVVNQMNSGYDPYTTFDVEKCDTYAHLWTYDLLVSCEDGDEYCECTFTEELMRMGLLSCSDAEICPDECVVCSNCIRSVCGQFVPSKIIAAGIESNAATAAAAIFATVLFAACFAFRRKRKKKSLLDESLMDTEEDSDMSSSGGNWMVPVNKDGLPDETGESCKPVWLVPDVSIVPRESIFPDLLKGTIDENTDTSESSETSTRKTKTREEERGVELSPVVSERSNSTKNHHPGPWLVPSANESIASSISGSIESDSYGFLQHDTHSDTTNNGGDSMLSDGRSIGTAEGEI